MHAIECLKTRVSVGKLQAPGPTVEQVDTLLQCAVRAPDYGTLRPWRFLIVDGDDRIALGQLMARAMEQAEGPLEPEKRARIESLPLRAPLLVVVIAKMSRHLEKVSTEEQLMSAAAAAQNILLAAHALGFGAIWRTGAFTKTQHLADMLKLSQDDKIVGFLYIGTPVIDKDVPETDIKVYSATLSEWMSQL